MTTPGSSPYPDRINDQKLGRQLAGLIAQQASSNLPFSVILSQLQDLLGDNTALLGPLRDLLGRPAFQQLFGLQRHSLQVGARDALLQDLALTYNSAMVSRIADVIDGCLGHPPSSIPPASQPSPYSTSPSSTSPSSFHNHRSPQGAPSVAPTNTTSAATGQFQGITAAPRNPDTSKLIVLVALMSGAVLVGLGWLFLGNRFQPGTSSASSSPTPRESPQPDVIPDNPATPTPPKDLTPAPSVPSQGAWGSASDYKFGQLPGGDYPQTCAFSRTDPSGRVNTDKSQMEFWACRDVGGDAENGYKVAWADGKETTYTFGAEGKGEVVGTNGSRHAIRWRNDTQQGDSIIVIYHQEGAVSWIPGNVR